MEGRIALIIEVFEDHLVNAVAYACFATMTTVMGIIIRANLHEPYLPEMEGSFVLIALTYALVIVLRKIKG